MLENEPLSSTHARQLIRKILRDPHGLIIFSNHATNERMVERAITEAEIYACLERGVCGLNITYERGTWRYPIEIPTLTVVVAFDTETQAIVITAWRRR